MAGYDHYSESPPSNLWLSYWYHPFLGRLWRRRDWYEYFPLRDLGTQIYHPYGQLVAQRIRLGGTEALRPQITSVIWAMMMGRWPLVGYVIDHKDNDRSNIKWSNLQEITFEENSRKGDRV